MNRRERLSLEAAPNPLTCEDLARVLLKAPSTIRAMAAAGQLPAVRSGRRYLFGRRRIEDYLNGDWTPTPTPANSPELRGSAARKAA